MRGALGAVVAVDALAAVTVVGVFAWLAAFGDFEGGFGDDFCVGVLVGWR